MFANVFVKIQSAAWANSLRHASWLAAVLLLMTCGADHERRDTNGLRTQRILFMGNSYTSFHNLPAMVTALAAALSPPVDIRTEMITAGGATLADHRAAGTVPPVLQQQVFDAVVLQEQSSLGVTLLINGRRRIQAPGQFFTDVRHFEEVARRYDADTLLFLTWATEYSPANQTTLTWAYMEIGRELGCRVVPVGIAWQRARDYLAQAGRQCPLYLPDGAHPSPAGTYLAACMFVTVLTGRSPLGLPSSVHVSQSDPEVAAFGLPGAGGGVPLRLGALETALIQRAVWEVYLELQQIGGHSVVEPGPPPEVPALPPGIPWRGVDLRGDWVGELTLFPGFERTGMVLTFSGEEDLPEVELHLSFEPPVQPDIRRHIRPVQRDGAGFRFTDPAGPVDTRIVYRGVYTGKTLLGIAEARRGNEVVALGQWLAVRRTAEKPAEAASPD